MCYDMRDVVQVWWVGYGSVRICILFTELLFVVSETRIYLFIASYKRKYINIV